MLDDRPHSGGRSVRGPAPRVLGRLMMRHQPQSLDGRRSVSRVFITELLADHAVARPLRSRLLLGHRLKRRLERCCYCAQRAPRGDGGPSRRSGFASSF